MPTPPPVIKGRREKMKSPKIKRVVTMKNAPINPQTTFNHGNIRRGLSEHPPTSTTSSTTTIPSRKSRPVSTSSMPSRKASNVSSRTKSPSSGPIHVNPSKMDPPPSSYRSDRGSVRNGHQRPLHQRPGPSNESYVSFGQRSSVSGSSRWTHDMYCDSNDDTRSIVPGKNNDFFRINTHPISRIR